MAKGYIVGLLNSVEDSGLKKVLIQAFDYVQDNWRLGTGVRAANAQWARVEGTTATVAGAEFSIRHGLGAAPHTLIPVLDLATAGAQLVPLTASRVADAERVYLSSTIVSATFTCFLEA
jgi:hypothetical protein